MLVRTLQVLVHAEHDTIWNLLLDRLLHPERYMAGISETRILEKSEDVMLREMKLHGNAVKERITVKPYDSEIDHELLEHPQFTGKMVIRIVRSARQSPVAPQYLEYDLELQRKSFKVQGIVQVEEEIIADLEGELHRLKLRAEEMETTDERSHRKEPPGTITS
jgi:acetylaranotin biosynthesis cluster protein L